MRARPLRVRLAIKALRSKPSSPPTHRHLQCQGDGNLQRDTRKYTHAIALALRRRLSITLYLVGTLVKQVVVP